MHLEPAVVGQVRFHEVVLQGLGGALGEHADEAVAVAVAQRRVVRAAAVRGAATAAGGVCVGGALLGAGAQHLAAIIACIPGGHAGAQGMLVVVLTPPEVLLLLPCSAGFVVCSNGVGYH